MVDHWWWMSAMSGGELTELTELPGVSGAFAYLFWQSRLNVLGQNSLDFLNS